jgi:hypothetical protein
MKFTPSPTAQVRVVDGEGKTTKIVLMNRAERRRLKIKKQK